MMNLWLVLLIVGALAVSALLTWVVRRYALARSVLDVPNDRSSHVVPTPRGGGLAIVLVVLAGLVCVSVLGLLSVPETIGLVGGAGLVAIVGWIDDHRPVSAAVRAVAHLLASAWFVGWIGGWPTLRFGSSVVELGLWGSMLAILAIAWGINAYNFMDGIDGIAGSEGVLVGLVAGSLLLAGGALGLGMVSLLIAAACAGFLLWNWAPAKIFMGDVGSGCLGFLLVALAVLSEQATAMSIWAWLLLLGVFVCDTAVTLIRRLFRRQAWYQAHRSHAYQRLTQAGWSHQSVTLSVCGVNVLLACGAVLVWLHPAATAWVLVVAVVMLGGLYGIVERVAPMRSDV